MNTNVRRRAVKAIIAVAIMASGGSVALARTNPGLAGQPYLPSDYQCFTNGAGAVQNSCVNTVKTYCMALPVETSSHNVQVTAFSPNGTHAIACEADATDRNSNVTWRSPLRGTPTFGTPSIIDLGTVSVPSFGALFVCCNMPDTTLLLTVSW